jgi:1-phosphofructokinase
MSAVTVTLNPAIDRTVTIPGFRAGEVNRVQHVLDHPGGKGVNVAASLAALGEKVTATGFLGRDNSAVFEAFFESKGIEDTFVRLPGATRVGIKILDPEQSQTTDINFPGLQPSVTDLDALRQFVQSRPSLWYVLAGSLPAGVEPEEYAALARQIQAAGGRVMLDTSGPALEAALAVRPDAIKPNVSELSALLGEPLSSRGEVVSAARRIVAQGVGLVVVSMGADGAVFVREGESVLAKPPRMQVRSTVGAGDAMVAGTVAGLLRDLPLAEIARLATACSMEVLSRPEPGAPAPLPAAALLSQVVIS